VICFKDHFGLNQTCNKCKEKDMPAKAKTSTIGSQSTSGEETGSPKTGGNGNNGGRKFNPTVGHGFENDKFGKGAIIVKIDAEGLKVLTENVQIGSSLLLKFNKTTTYGNKHYFCEVLPPYTGKVGGKLKTSGSQETSDLD
jgi:hypothetical protein